MLMTQHRSPEGSHSFLRVRVQIDSRAPLPPGFWFNHSATEDTWADFRYERLSDLCFRCGRLGHIINTCTFQRHPSAERLGPRMAIPALRPRFLNQAFDSRRTRYADRCNQQFGNYNTSSWQHPGDHGSRSWNPVPEPGALVLAHP